MLRQETCLLEILRNAKAISLVTCFFERFFHEIFWEILLWDFLRYLLILRDFFRDISSGDFIEEFLDFFLKRFLQGISRFLLLGKRGREIQKLFLLRLLPVLALGVGKNRILIILVKSVQFCNFETVTQKNLSSLQNAVINMLKSF